MIFSVDDDDEREGRFGVNEVITVSTDGFEEVVVETFGVTKEVETESDLGDKV